MQVAVQVARVIAMVPAPPTPALPLGRHLHHVTAATGQGYLLIAIATAAQELLGGGKPAWRAGGQAGGQRGIWLQAGSTGSALPGSPTWTPHGGLQGGQTLVPQG